MKLTNEQQLQLRLKYGQYAKLLIDITESPTIDTTIEVIKQFVEKAYEMKIK